MNSIFKPNIIDGHTEYPEGVPSCIFKPNIIDGHTPRKLNDAFHARNGRNYVKDSYEVNRSKNVIPVTTKSGCPRTMRRI